jgi:hypothetical protein
VHPIREIACGNRAHHEVDMVWHQARREYRQSQAVLRARDKREELFVISAFVKNLRLLIGAVQDVITAIGDYCPGGAWHAAKRTGAHSSGRRPELVRITSFSAGDRKRG